MKNAYSFNLITQNQLLIEHLDSELLPIFISSY